MSFAAAILGLAVLIFIHELGHFLAARAVGMHPRKFYLGFPPALVKTTRGGVEYGVGTIPLGGYVKLPGMHRPAPGDLRASLPEGRVAELQVPLDALDDALVRGDDAAALAQIETLAPALPGNRLVPEIKDGLAPDAYWRQRAWKRVVVIGAGPVANVLVALVLFAIVFNGAGTFRVTRGVESLLAGYPAQKAGLKAGDEIVRVAGSPVPANGLQAAIEGTRGRPFSLVVDRHGRLVTIGPLRARDHDGDYMIGFEIKTVPGPGESIGDSLTSSLSLVGSVTGETVQGIGELVHARGRKNVTSVVGMVRDTAQAYSVSLWDYVVIVGLLSLVLGLTNLLPLLPFDGGHIVMSVLEGLRRRAFSQLVYIRYSAVGLTIVVMLVYIGLRNDTHF